MNNLIFKTRSAFCKFRTICSKSSVLVGRDFISPTDLSGHDVKAILWTALDLKKQSAAKQTMKLTKPSHISLVLVSPSMRSQLGFTVAADELGATVVPCWVPDWHEQPDCMDSGRLLSTLSDVIVVNGPRQQDVVALADGAAVPVISSCSSCFKLVKSLSDLLTVYEHYQLLKGLTFAWVGPASPLCNTYFCLLPKLGINLRFHTICAHARGDVTPIKFDNALELCQQNNSSVHQFDNIEDTVYRADVIVTASHRDCKNTITLKSLTNSNLNWSFIHSLPRTQSEVADDVFTHKNNITWQSCSNTKYIAMALILRVLEKYDPQISAPDFDGTWQDKPTPICKY